MVLGARLPVNFATASSHGTSNLQKKASVKKHLERFVVYGLGSPKKLTDAPRRYLGGVLSFLAVEVFHLLRVHNRREGPMEPAMNEERAPATFVTCTATSSTGTSQQSFGTLQTIETLIGLSIRLPWPRPLTVSVKQGLLL